MGPLDGVVVLDLGQYLAGPFGPMILGDLGAEVIKVEPVRGDAMRMAVKPFLGCQRGKKDIAVDLKTPEGLEIVHRLAETADVVHHNMTKGVAERLGIDEETLRARNPGLVYCHTWAYGPEGPMSDFGGLDPLYQAVCGLEYDAGAVAEGNPPLYLRFGMTDTANAFASVVGVLAALFHKRRGGSGQDVWTSLLNAAALFSSDVFLTPDGVGPRRPPLDRDQMGTSPCYRLYATQDGWLQVAAVTSPSWRALCGLLGHPELGDDPRCATLESRAARRHEIEPVLEAAFRSRTAVAWQHLCDAAGVPAEVSRDTNDGETVLHDDDNVRLGLVTTAQHSHLGAVRQFGTLVGFAETPVTGYAPAPMVGEHTREIMLRIGYDHETVDAYRERGIVYEPDDAYGWSC